MFSLGAPESLLYFIVAHQYRTWFYFTDRLVYIYDGNNETIEGASWSV